MDIAFLLPFVVLIGAMFLMTRSAKKKQQQAAQMRDQMEPGTGVRTIGGMYARVKEVGEDTVLLEVAPGVHAHYAKNAVGAVLEDEEYDRIVHGTPVVDGDAPEVPDDASALTATTGATSDETIDLGKDGSGPDEPAAEDVESKDKRDGDSGTK
ncbi:preprotein translocase subunit YajC [Streptomyces sp. TRM 70351]|uniref:preprotein translocase subunit YajC n=1 Tax=Streptomyces sp. TRM 70351 TaxID=3116552 RepID=UPI002E7B1A69|nr:preprotein translocase subunit YajC [Streptomyces sp. TRM 70351]MEE1929079.1 preprotein translocase subunit YajC [Streptomyces sp. TRM 70351]